MGEVSLAWQGEKSAIKGGNLFPWSRRFGGRVPSSPISLSLNEVATPLGAEALSPRSGGLSEVMPPNSQRLFADVMPFAAGRSPIGLGCLRRLAVFRSGFALVHVLPGLPDHDGAQRTGRHRFGSGFPWARFRGAGLGRKIRAIPSLRGVKRQIFKRPC